MRKIIDISRPGEQIEEIEELVKKDKKGREKRKEEPKREKIKSVKIGGLLVFFRKIAGQNLFLAIAGIILVGFLFWLGSAFYSRADLQIKPKTEEKIFEDEVEININQTALNLVDKIAPGKLIEESQEISQTFETTSKEIDESKAKGTIRLYNSFNPPRTVALKENTRFLSSGDGKIFKCLEKIALPAAQLKDGKVVASFKDISVVAQEGGDDYNISPSKFSVPGLAGTALFYSIWGESTEPMTGGFKKEVVVVKKSDLENAGAALKDSLLLKAKESLRSKLEPDFILGDDAFLIKSFDYSCSNKEGDKVIQFNCQAKITIKGLVFKLSEIKEIALQKIRGEVPAEKDFDQANIKTDLLLKNLVSESGKTILSLKIRINQYDKIQQETIRSLVRGKNEKEIEQALVGFSQIESIKSEFWPFWVKKAPKEIERIKVEILP